MGQVIVTGANGYLGRACVAEARRRGLTVTALYRSTPVAGWAGDAGITALRADLAQPDTLPDMPDGAAVIHCAGHLGDDPTALQRDTLEATRHLLAACAGRQIRFVLISSLAVYDTDLLTPSGTLDEASPLVPVDAARDAYAGAKRRQEALLTQAGLPDLWILRPGAIWGAGRTWHALQGFWASKLFVTIGSDGELPLAHVSHVAWAALEAAVTASPGLAVLNVFDDDRPTRTRFLRAHRQHHGWPRLNVTVPYGIWLGLVRLLAPFESRLPGLFRAPVLRARMMPLRFPTTALRSALRGEDIDTFEGMMARTREGS